MKFLSVLLLGICSLAFGATSVVQDFRLNNGLTLIVKQDHRAPVVLSSVWYKVGSSYEADGITGISHMLEHMMFRGTKKYLPGEFDRLISEVGGQQNAMTTDDFTMYYQMLPASQLELSFKLEADRMQHLVVNNALFEKELQVVKEERRMRIDNDPQALTWERFRAAAFVNNPYHHPTIGWMTDVENFTAENVKNWYGTWYHPNNAVLVVVGDVQPDKVFALAKRYFGSIPKNELPHEKPRREVPNFGPKRIDVELPAKLAVVFIGYPVPSFATTNQNWEPYALDALTAVLGGSNSSRLQNDLLRGQEIVTAISSSYNPFSLHSGLLQIAVVPAPNVTPDTVKKAILVEIQNLQTKQIASDELDRIKAQLIASKVYSQDSLETQASTLGQACMSGLSWQSGENYVDVLRQVTPQQIQEVAKKYLQPSKITVAVLHPQKS